MSKDLPRILVVDDEFSVRDSLFNWFRKDGFDVETAENATEALRKLDEKKPDIVLLDIKMPGMDGLELQERIHGIDPHIAVIMITAFASVDSAVRALKHGAFDYVTKPIDPDDLSHLVKRALDHRRLRDENAQLRETIDDLVGAETIVGESPEIERVFDLVKHVAQTEATVMIRGESGTGKELIARAIHANSPRRYLPLVPVNCGALAENLLESELFGHEKGAFTGAQFRRKGKLELSDGGTLFLDEIGTISQKTQIDLLRVLESKEFTRVGGNQTVKVDFRVICATNENLEEMVESGKFRQDLYYRLNVFAIDLPALRERPGDIPLLAAHFVRKFAAQMDTKITEISPEALEGLLAYDWPGNVRELQNAIERAMVVGRPPAILPRDLPFLDRRLSPVGETLADVERAHIAQILERTDWNISRAAEVLKVDRTTIYSKIKKYELRRKDA